MTKKLLHDNVICIATRQKLPRSYSCKGNKYVNTIVDCLDQRRNQISDILVLWREKDQTNGVKISHTPMTAELQAYFSMHMLGTAIVDEMDFYTYEDEEYTDL